MRATIESRRRRNVHGISVFQGDKRWRSAAGGETPKAEPEVLVTCTDTGSVNAAWTAPAGRRDVAGFSVHPL